MTDSAPRWWERPDLGYRDGSLQLGGHDLAELARRAGTPAFFYSAERVAERVGRLQNALDATGLVTRIRYAMKANRFMPLLTLLRERGLCGIDACSPGELRLALQCGFTPEAVSYTNTSVSDGDLDILARYPELWINLDSISSIRRFGRRVRGAGPPRTIGLRVNPAVGVGYGDNQLLRYAGPATTKFGIYREQFAEALAVAREEGLRVRGIHFHTGCGYLSEQLPLWGEILRSCRWFLDQLEEPLVVNLGGGLGVPHRNGDRPIDLESWSALIGEVFGASGVEVWVEPGDFIVKDAGVLLLQVNTVEQKRDTLFVGLDGGFNLAMEPAFYQLPCHPLPCRPRPGVARRVTLAGNINEALDLWARDIELPPLEEGDYLALINAGGYAAVMASNHCMRGNFSEYLLLGNGPG